MKKQAYVIIALTSILFVLFFSHSLLEILDFDWSIFLQDVEKTEKFIFLLLVFSMSMTFLLALFWRGIEELSLRKMHTNLKRLLAGQEVVQVADPDLDANFKRLKIKVLLRKRKSLRRNGSDLLGICTIQLVRSCLRLT